MESSFPSGSYRHLHRSVSSPGPKQGHWESRYAIHASRQLSGEVLRYLKRVRVTPALYWSFFGLKPAFRYQQWVGVSHHTQPFGSAMTCVFGKQSLSPCY